MSAQPDITGLVGVPFVDHGRDETGCDCYGLVRLVYARAGVELPEHSEISAHQLIAVAKRFESARLAPPWRLLETAAPLQPMDVAVMRSFNRPGSQVAAHVGVLVRPGVLLHSEEGAGAHLADPADRLVAPRILGWSRHKAFDPDGAPS